MPALPKLLFAVAGLAALAGLVLWRWPAALSWFGRLPGDIRIENEHARVYVPWVSTLLISAVVSLASSLLGRLMR